MSCRLSASKASVWTECSGSVYLSSTLSKTNSLLPKTDLSNRGIKLHKAASDLLLRNDDTEYKFIHSYDSELAGFVMYYVNFIRKEIESEEISYKFIEEKLEFNLSPEITFVAIPDYACVSGDLIYVIDLKTGYTVIPSDNLQNRIYAHILFHLVSQNSMDIRRAKLITVMPALKVIDSSEIELDGNFLQNLGTTFLSRGENFSVGYHCRFCDCVTFCSELRQRLSLLHDFSYREEVLRDSSFFVKWWGYKKIIDKFYERLEQEILSLADFNLLPSGLKVIERNNRRQWVNDIENKLSDLESDFNNAGIKVSRDDFIEERILTPPQLEKKLRCSLPSEIVSKYVVQTQTKQIVIEDSFTDE